jgi:hypothetical protein
MNQLRALHNGSNGFASFLTASLSTMLGHPLPLTNKTAVIVTYPSSLSPPHAGAGSRLYDLSVTTYLTNLLSFPGATPADFSALTEPHSNLPPTIGLEKAGVLQRSLFSGARSLCSQRPVPLPGLFPPSLVPTLVNHPTMNATKVPEFISRPFLLLRLVVFSKSPLLVSVLLLTKKYQLSCFCLAS